MVHIDLLKSEKSANGEVEIPDSYDDSVEFPKLYYFVAVAILITPIFPVLHLMIFLKRILRPIKINIWVI